MVRCEAQQARRNIVVLALDGIPARLAFPCWSGAALSPLRSVFPTTSSAGWLSSLAGAPVDAHGIPGVVFALDDGRMVNLYQHQAPWHPAPAGNMFSDAAALGYSPIAITADLEAAECSWTRLLVQGARRVIGHRFFARDDHSGVEPQAMRDQIRNAVHQALALDAGAGPQLVWCFIEVDRHVHRHGYDERVMRFLAAIGELADGWAADGLIVVAHSDHGLVRTAHDTAVDATLQEVCHRFRCRAGGAGRTRWFHDIAPGEQPEAIDWLAHELGAAASVHAAGEMFRPGSLAHRRVGSVLAIARGERFATFDGHAFDHGSLCPDELETPYACWRA